MCLARTIPLFALAGVHMCVSADAVPANDPQAARVHCREWWSKSMSNIDEHELRLEPAWSIYVDSSMAPIALHEVAAGSFEEVPQKEVPSRDWICVFDFLESDGKTLTYFATNTFLFTSDLRFRRRIDCEFRMLFGPPSFLLREMPFRDLDCELPAPPTGE